MDSTGLKRAEADSHILPCCQLGPLSIKNLPAFCFVEKEGSILVLLEASGLPSMAQIFRTSLH